MKKKRFLTVLLSATALLGLSSCGEQVKAPEITIGENGNWFIDGVDQGVRAKGEKGDKGDSGDKGDNGTNGVSVVSILKTDSQNNVDTYTVVYSNNTTSTFTVKNGTNGTNGTDGISPDPLTIKNVSLVSSAKNIDTYEIEFSDGYKTNFAVTNGKDGVNGENLSVVSIAYDSSEGLYDTYKISFSDNSSQTFIVKNGADGHTPEITIGENGNWFVDGVDQGVKAQGEQGTKGDKGVSIVSIEKTKTQDNIDTYTITYSDNTSSSFVVTNGVNGADADALTIKNVTLKNSANNVDTYEIEFSDGYKATFTVTNGKDGEAGKDMTVVSIEYDSTEGLYDTYRINFSDNSSQTFVVKNGENGKTPYIGDNGNWWIGDVDTGVLASFDTTNSVPLTIYSSGLKYETRTINGKSGFVVTGWNKLDSTYLNSVYGQEQAATFSNVSDKTLVIPDYIGSVPVIGVMGGSNLNFGKVVLSKNTIYLGEDAFSNCSNLKDIDFNGCKLTSIPEDCFYSTSLKSVNLPETVTHIFDRAFSKVLLDKVDLKNVKYIGNNAFDGSYLDYIYLNDNIEYVGSDAFYSTFVYVEAPEKPSTWGSISSKAYAIKYNAKINDEYIYSIDNNEVTIYQYLGNEKKLVVPAEIDDKPITAIGAGFNSYVFGDTLSGLSASEKYRTLKNKEGYITELVVGNNVKKIEQYALMNGNMFIYIDSNVEEIYVGDTVLGAYKETDEDVTPIGLVVINDTTKTKFNYSGTIKTYSELVDYDDDYEVLFKININYDDIYCENDIYYNKTINGYEVLYYANSYADDVTILDSIDNIKVTSIGKYAFLWKHFGKLMIGDNVTKIRSNAFYECSGDVFIPSNVSIVNASGFYYHNEIIYVEASQKPEDWDTNWKTSSGSGTVIYSASKDEFINTIKSGDFVGVIKSDNTIELTKYNGSSKTVYIPRTINGRTVTSIATGFIKTSSTSSGINIYIPSTVTTIAGKAIDLYQYNYTAYIYLETDSIPSTYESNWYYNSRYNNTSYITVETGTKFDY